MRRGLTGFLLALLLYAVSGVLAATLALAEENNDSGTISGGIATGILMAALLCFFAHRGHRWPKWFLLVLLVGGIGAVVSYLDARSLLALIDVAALVVLLRSWTDLEQRPAEP